MSYISGELMMKKLAPLFLLLLALQACATTTFFKDKITMNQLLESKANIDATDNVAKQLLLQEELTNKIIILNNLKVKDVVTSSNVDYDFCALSDIKTENGNIELYIYTKNIRALSRLEKNKSFIDVTGELSRFFSTLDSYYLKIEIINSKIKVVKPEPSAEQNPQE